MLLVHRAYKEKKPPEATKKRKASAKGKAKPKAKGQAKVGKAKGKAQAKAAAANQRLQDGPKPTFAGRYCPATTPPLYRWEAAAEAYEESPGLIA